MVAVRDVTSFAWDELFILGPRTSEAQIAKVLGSPAPELRVYELEKHDMYVLVFRKNGRYLRSENVLRVGFFFTQDALNRRLTPASAVFRVLKKGEALTFVPMKSH